jgi:hypothetical protein
MMRRLPFIALVCVFLGTARAHADVITFDNITAQPGNLTEFGILFVDGFVFSSPHAHVVTTPLACEPDCAVNGTFWIGGDTTQIAMEREDRGTFSLARLDAAEAFTTENTPSMLDVRGLLKNGSVLTASFAFDGVNDSTGSLRDFQTFALGGDWNGLVRVSFMTHDNGWFGLDNVVTSAATPEPATLVLCATGLATATGRRLRRERPRA